MVGYAGICRRLPPRRGRGVWVSKLGYFKKELELSRDRDIVYGKCGDYIVTFNENEWEVELFVDARLGSVETERIEALKQFVQRSAAGYKLQSFSVTSTGASVVVLKKNADSLLEFSTLLLSEMKTLGIPGDTVCSNCGRRIGTHRLVRIANHAHSCDPECVERLLENAANQKPARTRHKGSFVGFIGALFGVILAAAGYVYLGLNGWFCAGVAVLMPAFASAGYALFGGKPSVSKGMAVILLPLLFFAAAAFFVLLYSVYHDWIALGYVFSLRELFDCVAQSLLLPALKEEFLIKQLAEGGIFLLIGYIFSLPQAFSKKQPPRIQVLS